MRKKEFDPFNWDNISIDKYYQIKDILDDPSDDDMTKNVKLVSVILDKDEQEVWDMELIEVGGYISRLKFLGKFELPRAPQMKIQLPSYKVNVIKDLTKINMAQYVDYHSFAVLPFREGIDKLLSVFLIPEGKSYNTDYDIVDLQREIRENMSFRVAEGLISFFLRKYSDLLINSLWYCRKKIKRMKRKEERETMMEQEKTLEKKIQDLIHLVG